MTQDHNLLFGVFAVQLNKVSPVDLMDVASSWAADTSRDLPTRLVERGMISEGDRDLLQRFVDEAVAAHGGDVHKTLASFGGEAQVHQAYRGSIVLTADGQVSIPPTAKSPDSDRPDAPPDDVSTVKGVFETPGRYTNSIEHARGGMGRVLLVHDDFLGRDIALKELLPHLGTTEATTRDGDGTTADGHPSPVRFSAHIIARFLQEARITGQLEHPSIVPVYELGHRKDGSLYYTMKLVRGRSLSKAIKECNTLEERLRLLPHFVDLCQAIAYAHSREIIHRDIKPANVMVGEFGETVVLDWGLAKKRDRKDVHKIELEETLHAMNLGDEVAAAKTAYGQVMGTPVYMAPEQAKGDLEAVDEQSDVYSLGVVLYEILTGQVPFDGKSTREVLNKVIAGDWISIDRISSGAPPELVAVVEKSMRKRIEDRYQDVRSLADEVERFQSGAMVKAHRYTFAGYTRFVWKRYKPVIATVSMAVLALLVLSVAYTYQLAASRDREAAARETAERNAYVANIRLTQGQVERGETILAHDRLLNTPEQLRNWEWGYLYVAMDKSLLTLQSPRLRGIRAYASLSPDGALVVCPAETGHAQVLDIRSNTVVQEFRDHDENVLNAAFSPDGRYVATASQDYTSKLWDVQSGEELLTFRGHENAVLDVAFSSDGSQLLTSSSDGTAIVWDVRTAEAKAIYRGHDASVHAGYFSEDGSTVVTIDGNQRARIWDAVSGAELAVLHTRKIGPKTLSADGSRAVDLRGRVPGVLDLDTGSIAVSGHGHTDPANYVQFSPDDSLFVSTGYDDSARVWDTDNGKQQLVLANHTRSVFTATISPDGAKVLTGSEDKSARVWDMHTGNELITLGGHTYAILRAEFSVDGRSVLTSDGSLRKIWPVGGVQNRIAHRGGEVSILRGHTADVFGCAFSPDGSRIVTASKDGTARIWDVESGECGVILRGHEDFVWSAQFDSTGTRVFTGSNDGSIRLWNAATGELSKVFSAPQARVFHAELSPDGTRFLTASADGHIRIWDSESGNLQREIPGAANYYTSASFSPNSRQVHVATGQSSLAVWDLDTGEMVLELRGHSGRVRRSATSGDGSRIVTASEDGTARLWDRRNGDELLRMEGHTNSVVDVAFSPDEKRILTASWDKTVRLWDATSGGELLTLRGPTQSVWEAAFSPDGSRIAAVSGDGTLDIWRAAPWEYELWYDPDARDELIDLALRQSAKTFRLSYRRGSEGFSDVLEMLKVLPAKLLDPAISVGDIGFEEVPGRGLWLRDSRFLASVGTNMLQKDDILIRINGISVDSIAEAGAVLKDFAERVDQEQHHVHYLVLDAVNRYVLKAYVLEIHPEERNPLRGGSE